MIATRREIEATDSRVREMFVRYHPLALETAGRMYPSLDHEAIASEVMTRGWRNLDRINLVDAEKWFIKATVHSGIDQARQEGRHNARSLDSLPRHLEPSDPTYEPEKLTLQAERIQIIWNAIGALPETRRRVVELSLYHEAKEEETATTLEIARGSVKSNLSRARKVLVRNLAQINDPEHDLPGLGTAGETFVPEMFTTGPNRPFPVKAIEEPIGSPQPIPQKVLGGEWLQLSAAALLRDAVLANALPLPSETSVQAAPTVRLIQIDQAPPAVDRAELEKFILDEQTRNLMLRVAIRLIGNKESAEDAVQQAQLKAWQNMEKFRAGNMKAWILRITVNTVRSQGRKTKQPTIELPEEYEFTDFDPHIDPQKEIFDHEIKEAIDKAMAGLTDEQKLFVELYNIQGMSYQEIANITDSPIGTVCSALYRGRKKIKTYLKTNFPDLVEQFESPKPSLAETAMAS